MKQTMKWPNISEARPSFISKPIPKGKNRHQHKGQQRLTLTTAKYCDLHLFFVEVHSYGNQKTNFFTIFSTVHRTHILHPSLKYSCWKLKNENFLHKILTQTFHKRKIQIKVHVQKISLHNFYLLLLSNKNR